jgi:Fe-S cluster biogenesis protein NfuA/nitrite reductase/ring-hydroxylating ferredoxin subunit
MPKGEAYQADGMPDETQLRIAGDRIEALLGELAAAGPAVRGKAEELVQSLMRLYGAGLERILTVLDDAGPAAIPVFARLAEDELVASLLVLHDLHPLDLETRIARALDHVRPYLGSHGGGVELVSVVDGMVRLRLEGSCDGCPSSAVTMKLAIERAIEEAAPEIAGIEVDGLPAAASKSDPPAASDGQGNGGRRNGEMVQIGQGRGAAKERDAGHWIAVAAPELGAGGLAVVELAGTRVVLCKPGDAWYAYRDLCPACGAPLATGALHDELLSCASCARRYDVRRAGSLAGSAGPPLEPLPLLSERPGSGERDVLRIAVPAGRPLPGPAPAGMAAVS